METVYDFEFGGDAGFKENETLAMGRAYPPVARQSRKA